MTRPFQVLVAGGGVAALEAVLGIRELAPSAHVTWLTATQNFVHEPLAWDKHPVVRVPLDRLAALCDAELVRDQLVRVDPASHDVTSRQAGTLRYDALVVAVGAHQVLSVDAAVSVSGRLDAPRADAALDSVRGGWSRRPVVVIPDPDAWTLPAYELALTAATYPSVRPLVVTVEEYAAEALGGAAAEAVSAILATAGVRVLPRAGTITDTAVGQLRLGDGRVVDADLVFALPHTRGPRIAGLPTDRRGYVPADETGAVPQADGIWAAGDVVSSPVKPGGLAARQGATVAAQVAAAAGSDVDLTPLAPLLRGVLLTPDGPLFVERDLRGDGSRVSMAPLWDPPHHRVAGVRVPRLIESLHSAVT